VSFSSSSSARDMYTSGSLPLARFVGRSEVVGADRERRVGRGDCCVRSTTSIVSKSMTVSLGEGRRG
jgi:hypothetical protein